MQRRRFLADTVLLAVATASLPGLACAASARRPRFVAAWDDAAGDHHLGLLAWHGLALQVLASIALPTRAHGLLREPGGSVLAAARRPGEWLLRWSPAHGTADWFWSPPEHRHTGHLLRHADGQRLFSAETDTDSGAGLIAVRDARSLAVLDLWPTHGIDPHQFLFDADGSLVVANGGVPTLAETGRTKQGLERMDASLVRLDSRSGALRGQWRLDDARLSIRHLARHADGTFGIALQAEHDDAAAKAGAPLLALFDGQALRSAELPQALAGYGGDIAATAAGFAVSAPRAGGVARWGADGRWMGFTPLAEGCALATLDGTLWAGGRGEALACADAADTRRVDLAALRLDNHWLALPAPR
jgi:uncharacterized protein